MRKGILLVSFIAAFSIISVPSYAYIEYGSTNWDDVPSANLSTSWNVIGLEAGLNSYAIYPCPSMSVENAVRMGIGEFINWIRYTNSTGDYYWYETYHAENNLTDMTWGELYDYNMSSATYWICPCEVTGEWSNNDANVIGFPWYGGDCDLCQFGGTCGGTSDGYYPECAGVVNRSGGVIYWEVQQSGAWKSWISQETVNTLASINETQWYYWNPDANLTDALNDVHMTWDFGIKCLRTVGQKLIINVHTESGGHGIFGAMVNLTHMDTGTTIIGYTNPDGVAEFNLTLTGFWEFFASADNYAHLYPAPTGVIEWTNQPITTGIVMRELTAEEVNLNVRVCEWNTTWDEEAQVWIGGLPGFGFGWQTGSASCLPISSAAVIVQGNGSVYTGYTGSKGHSVFTLNHSWTYYIAVNKTGYEQISPGWNMSIRLNDSNYKNYNIIMGPKEQIGGVVIPLDDQMSQPLVNMPFGEAGWVGLLFTPVSIITMFLVGIGAWFEAQVRSKGAIFCLVVSAGALLFTYLGFYPTWVGLVLVVISSGIFVYFIKGVAGR